MLPVGNRVERPGRRRRESRPCRMVNGEWMYVCVGAGGRWPVSDLGLRQFGRLGARALRMDPSPRRCAASFHSPRRGALKVVHSSRQRIHPLPFLTFSLQTPTSLSPLSTLRTLLRLSCPSWSISKLSSSSRLPTKSQERKLAYSRVIACPTAPDPWMQPIEHDIQPASLSPTLEWRYSISC